MLSSLLPNLRIFFSQKLKKDLEEKKPALEAVLKEIPEIKEKVGEEGIKPIEEKCTELQCQMDECGVNLDELLKSLDDQINHAEPFNAACEELKKWLPVAEQSPAIVEPISSDPAEILKQIEDVKVSELLIFKYHLCEYLKYIATLLSAFDKLQPSI